MAPDRLDLVTGGIRGWFSTAIPFATKFILEMAFADLIIGATAATSDELRATRSVIGHP